MRSSRSRRILAALIVASAALGCGTAAQSISDQPDTPFKLATFEPSGGDAAVGLVLGERVLEISAASDHLAASAQVSAMSLPSEMRELIEQYDRVGPRLYQIANYFAENGTDGHAFAHDVGDVKILAPIKYPWNLLAAAANYKAHAEGMRDAGDEPAANERGGRRGGFDPSRIAQIDPSRDAPVMFAKSPRSCIIDPGAPYYVPPGRERIDWEGEMAVILGKSTYLISPEDADDHIFGYSIVYDLSDRGGRTREVSMFPGPNWFDGKSVNRGAPFGPYIVPKEFVSNPKNLRLVTKVNGVVMQDQTTADLIWPVDNLIAYTSSILELHPGDVIATGTPSGTGAERGEFLKPGDVVEIELEGVGTLTTPIEAYSPAR